MNITVPGYFQRNATFVVLVDGDFCGSLRKSEFCTSLRVRIPFRKTWYDEDGFRRFV
jgi:hypothetical protein